jgi:beta-xylosidase
MVLRLALRPSVESSGESAYDPRGWSTLGRETSIQKVYWDEDGWPRIEGGHGGKPLLKAPSMPFTPKAPKTIASMMSLKPQRSIPTGIRCVSRSAKKWAPPAMGN